MSLVNKSELVILLFLNANPIFHCHFLLQSKFNKRFNYIYLS